MGRDPADLYEAEPGAPTPDRDLVLLYYLDGFIDAGGAGRLLAAHLLDTLEHEQVARFDVDSLIDYRSRRPAMTFSKDHWETYDAPELEISLLRDTAERCARMLPPGDPLTSQVQASLADIGG